MKSKSLTMELLSDPANQVAEKYGLVYRLPEDLKKLYLKFGIDLEEYNNDSSWTLPMPARYIVDRSGLIRYAEINPDYTVRPDLAHTIDALKKIVS